MNTPIGPESESLSGDSRQMVATNKGGAVATSAWVPPAPMWLDGAPGDEGIDFSVFLHSLRRKWLPGLLIGSVLAALASVLLFLLIPVSFEAISFVRVNRSEPHPFKKSFSSDPEYMAYKQTQATLMTTPFVLSAALREPGISQLPLMQRQDNPLDWLTKEIRAVFPGDSELMQIGMHGDRMEDIKKIVDAVVSAYLIEIAQSEKTEKGKQLDTLRGQQRRNENAIREKSEIINRLSDQIGSSDSDVARLRSRIAQDELTMLSRRRSMVEDEIGTLVAEQIAIKAARDGAMFYKPDQRDVDLLLERDRIYAEAKMQVSAIQQAMVLTQGAAGFGGGGASPYQTELALAAQTLQRRREELTPLLEHQIKREYTVDDSGSATQMQVLQTQVQLKQEQLKSIDQAYRAKLEDVKNLNGFSSDLIARRQELFSIQESTQSISREIARLEVELLSEARIQRIQHATIPNEGSYFLKMVEVVGGGLMTLFATLLAVTLWDYKAKRLNSSDDVQNSLRLPVIGTVPSLRAGIGGLLGGRAASESVVSDSIDSVRSAILYGGRAVKSVMVTSAVGHEGKSTVASQLAVSLARAGRRTLLVDADIRNPQQHAVFGLPLDRGLCDVIRGQANVEEVIQATPAEGLWILPAGRCDMAVMQAMSGPAFPQMMDRLNEQFEFVILDSGPVLTGPGAIICGQHVDAAILSTRRDVSRIPKIDDAYKRLQSVGVYVMGSVVNGTSADVRSNQLSLSPVS